MNHEKLSLLIPWDEIEESAREQITNLLEMPAVDKVAIMPDVHCAPGNLAPIGGVVLCRDKVFPRMVGVDIGCGMINMLIDVKAKTIKKNAEKIHAEIMKRVPVGFASHMDKQDYADFECSLRETNPIWVGQNAKAVTAFEDKINAKAKMQIGTLGGGNHFIEIGMDAKNCVAITVHSGSRNPGHTIASFYMNHADNGLYADSPFGRGYLADYQWAADFALENRMRIMKATVEAIATVLGHDPDNIEMPSTLVNKNHNTVDVVPDGFLHRKGATPAEAGMICIIPGSMKSGVAIASGLGNEEFLNSCSHGSGRAMSRKKAAKAGTLDRLKVEMKGIVGCIGVETLDEAPWAYKDHNYVLGLQDGKNIEILSMFTPMINVKG